MLEQIAAYLEKLGYTAEKQGTLEKYLVVFLEGHPIGFILSDSSVRLVAGAEGAESIKEILGFIKKNQDLQCVGKSEFLLASYRRNQLTTYYDGKDRLIRYAVYIHDDAAGEGSSTVYESYDDAAYRFMTLSHMIDLKKYLPRQEGFADRLRIRLARYLMSKSSRQAERF